MPTIQMMLLFAAVTYFLSLHMCHAGDPCPPKSSLAPCTCTQVPLKNGTFSDPAFSNSLERSIMPEKRERRDTSLTAQPESAIETNTIVQCRVSKSILALEETVSSALNRMSVDKLIVASVPPAKEHILARLPKGWLKNVRVRQFEVTNSMLSGDFIRYGAPFADQEQSLVWFAAIRCSLSGSLTYDTTGTTQTKGLNLLTRLEVVDFSHNYLTSIMSLSFRNPPANLSAVVLSYNSIQNVEAGTFQHISQLKHVDLSHNLLEFITRSIFPPQARRLEHIDLSWNSLKVLPPDFFSNMPALLSVNISRNFLYSAPEKPWAMVWTHLTDIDLTGNFLECNCDLMWLLPILSPPQVDANATTQTPGPLPGQTVRGSCSKTIGPLLFAMRYDLVTLTNDRLAC